MAKHSRSGGINDCFIITRTARVVLFSVVYVCVSVNTITPESLEISSRNFQGISRIALSYYRKGGRVRKWLWGARGGD